MIIDEVSLTNFGPYAGEQTVRLTPPSNDKPITLIGALNGGGKTSLLDGIQLCLYGKMASISKRGSQRYEDYLRSAIHRRADPAGGAQVSVAFRHRSEGVEHVYRVDRVWSCPGKTVKEHLVVHRDGFVDDALSSTWSEHVDRFLPVRLAPLFLFDGEKIEALADPDHAADALRTAIHSLLGLDLVDQLQTDLRIIERKRRSESAVNEADIKKLTDAEGRFEAAEAAIIRLTQEQGSVRNALDQAKKALNVAERRFQECGGTIYENRKILEQTEHHIGERIKDKEQRVRELIAGPAPFLLIRPLLAQVADQYDREQSAAQHSVLADVLVKRDRTLLKVLQAAKAPVDLIAVADQFLVDDRSSRLPSDGGESYLKLTPDGGSQVKSLLNDILPVTETDLRQLLDGLDRDRRELTSIQRQLAGIPDEQAVAVVIDERKDAQRAVTEQETRSDMLDEKMHQLSTDRDRCQRELDDIARCTQVGELASKDLARYTSHTEKAVATLNNFRTALVAKHLKQIEKLVLDSFQHLLHKQALVHGLSIDPIQYTLHLTNEAGLEIAAKELSAGERQLLATSLLWGLARASGRPMPVIIDTPLGRLDSEHRALLVSRYFPFASHQVILLSTDEEIDETHLTSLRSRIGHSYTLVHDESLDGTVITPGYQFAEQP